MAGSLLKALAWLTALAALAAPMRPAGFSFSGVSNRFVTPNGDGRNDDITFLLANPRDSAGTLRVFDLRGRRVAEVSIDPTASASSSVSWTPGRDLPPGVYVYVITVEQTSVSGTVVVLR